MKDTSLSGVFREKRNLFTETYPGSKGLKIYNERLVRHQDKEYRSWNPYRSKLAAAILKGFKVDISKDSSVLYLGAATGTTVSHISDIVHEGVVYAVENSPVVFKKLLQLSKSRKNVLPVLKNANHPDSYSYLVEPVDLVYQDISQRNQSEIFVKNIRRYLKEKGTGILMAKARSIDVSLKPKKAYEKVCSYLENNDLIIKDVTDLSPYEKDHAVIKITL